jgi:hypothetical protein
MGLQSHHHLLARRRVALARSPFGGEPLFGGIASAHFKARIAVQPDIVADVDRCIAHIDAAVERNNDKPLVLSGAMFPGRRTAWVRSRRRGAHHVRTPEQPIDYGPQSHLAKRFVHQMVAALARFAQALGRGIAAY